MEIVEKIEKFLNEGKPLKEYKIGDKIYVSLHGSKIDGTFKGIEEDGKVKVELVNGKTITVSKQSLML